MQGLMRLIFILYDHPLNTIKSPATAAQRRNGNTCSLPEPSWPLFWRENRSVTQCDQPGLLMEPVGPLQLKDKIHLATKAARPVYSLLPDNRIRFPFHSWKFNDRSFRSIDLL